MLDAPQAERKQRAVLIVAFLGAGLVHLGAALALGAVGTSTALAVERTPPPVEFVVVPEPEAAPEPPAPEPEPVAPEPAPEPEPVVRREPPPPRPTNAPPPPAAAEPPPAAAETPVDFSNTTLLSNSNTGNFAMQQSSGVASDRIGRPGAAVTGRSREGTPGGVVGGTGDGPAQPVALADLRERPRPPSDLDAVLRRFYPAEAQSQGIAGRAVARFVILADGRPTSIRVGNESVAGFGFAAACKRAIEAAGNWSAPIGPDGRPTSTRFSMSCAFDIR